MYLPFDRYRSSLRWLAGLAAILSLGACAHIGGAASPEEQVQRRAEQRWAQLLKKDFSKAYGYLTPYNRATLTREAFVREMGEGNAWLSAEVASVTCEPQLCKTRVRLVVASPMPNKFGDKITTHIDEEWVLVDGEWWYSRR